MKLKINPERMINGVALPGAPITGLYVRAVDDRGVWRSVDIGVLERASVLEWLDTDPELAKKVVLALLNHKH